MLKPKEESPKITAPTVISVRLTAPLADQLGWLMDHLSMTRTEVIQSLITQEYEEHHARGDDHGDS